MTNNKIPRICMVVERFYPQVGGSETQALNLSSALQKTGIELFVLTRRTLKEMPPCEEIGGIRVFRVLPTGTRKLSLLGAALSFFYFLFRRRKEYDIIHCHGMGWAGPVSSLAGWLLRKKTLVKVATAGDVSGKIVGKKEIPWPVNAVRLFLLSLSTKLICISQEIELELRKKGFSGDRLINIPNGVDIERFRPGNGTRKLFPKDRLNIVFSGRIVYRKGIDVLLRTLADLRKIHPNAHVHILGSGRLQTGDAFEDNLISFVRDNNLEGHVTFHGNVDNVEDYLREADIFAFPSRHEGLPNALLEAMACGLPVVATSIGGVIDMVKDGENGLLVRPDDHMGLLNALDYLIKAPRERTRLGLAAMETIKEKYSISAISERYKNLYRDL